MPTVILALVLCVIAGLLWDIRRTLVVSHGIAATDLLKVIAELKAAHERLASVVEELRIAHGLMAAVVEQLRVAHEKLEQMEITITAARMTAMGVEVAALRENLDTLTAQIKPVLAALR